MSSLILTAAFPTGHYLAHDFYGHPEWPPHPARLACAILSTAYTHQRGIPTARRLFDLPPPVIHTPSALPRDTNIRRWVPVDIDVELRNPPRRTKLGRLGKLLKDPERGTVTARDQPLYYVYPDTETHLLDGLDQLLALVPYLGRPTSPAILGRADTTPTHLDTYTRWTPAPSGAYQLRIANPRLLTALDEREQARNQTPITGSHPEQTIRPTTSYRRDEPGTTTTGDYQAASPSTIHSYLTRLTIYPTPNAHPNDLPAVLEALNLDPHSEWALPITGRDQHRGHTITRLYSVGLHQSTLRPNTPVVLNGRVTDLIPRAARGTTTEHHAIAQALATSSAWTTSTPLPALPDTLRDAAHDLAAAHHTHVLDATIHPQPRDDTHPHLPHRDDLTHLSVLFARAIAGPLPLNGTALQPINPNENHPTHP